MRRTWIEGSTLIIGFVRGTKWMNFRKVLFVICHLIPSSAIRYLHPSSNTVVRHPIPSHVTQYRHPSSGTATVLLSFSTAPIPIKNPISDIQNLIKKSGTGYRLLDDGIARYRYWMTYRMVVVKPYLSFYAI